MMITIDDGDGGLQQFPTKRFERLSVLDVVTKKLYSLFGLSVRRQILIITIKLSFSVLELDLIRFAQTFHTLLLPQHLRDVTRIHSN